MLYKNLVDGLKQFKDLTLQEIAEDPVYFLHHPSDASIIYEKDSAESWFAKTAIDLMHFDWLTHAENNLLENLMQDQGLQKLIEEHAAQILGQQTIAAILAVQFSERPEEQILIDEILHGASLDPVAFPEDVQERISLTLATVYGQAKTQIHRQIIGLQEGQTRCPNTREIISSADMRSAKPFLHVFLIAARNAMEANSGEFVEGNGADKEATAILRQKLAALSEQEQQEAEVLLERICDGQNVPLPEKHLQRLREWGVRADNPAISSSKRRAQTRFDALPFLQDPDLENQYRGLTDVLLGIDKLNIRFPAEKAHFHLLLKDAYNEIADVLALTYIQNHHFETIRDLVTRYQETQTARQAIAQEIAHHPSDPRIGMRDVRERYREALIKEENSLREAIEKAKVYFEKLAFHQEENVLIQLREVNAHLRMNNPLGHEKLAAEHYAVLLRVEKERLEKAIQVADQYFMALPFHKEAKVSVARQQMQAALEAIPGLGLEETAKKYYEAQILEAREKCNRPFINLAEGRFARHQFDKISNLLIRQQQISKAVKEADGLGIEDEVEKAHYVGLLQNVQQHLAFAMQNAEQRFRDNRFSDLQDFAERCITVDKCLKEMPKLLIADELERAFYEMLLTQARNSLANSLREARRRFNNLLPGEDYTRQYQAITDELTRLNTLGELNEENLHYRNLLDKRKDEYDAAKQSATGRFEEVYTLDNLFSCYQKMVETDLGQFKFDNPYEKHYFHLRFVSTREALRIAIENAEKRFASHNFDKEPELFERRGNIAAALASIDVVGIVDALEKNHYRALLVHEQDQLDLILTRADAQRRLDALNVFEEDDFDGMEAALERAAADVGNRVVIPNRFEAINYQNLIEQTKRLIAFRREMEDYVSKGEKLLEENESLFSSVSGMYSALSKAHLSLAAKQDLAKGHEKLGQMLQRNSKLGEDCTALAEETGMADEILAAKPIDIEMQFQQLVLKVRNKLVEMQGEADLIKQALFEVQADFDRLGSSIASPLASQLQALQQQFSSSGLGLEAQEEGHIQPLLIHAPQRQLQSEGMPGQQVSLLKPPTV